LPRPDRSDVAIPVRTRPTRAAAAGARGGAGRPCTGCRRTAHPALVPGATRRRRGRRTRAGRNPRHQLRNPLPRPAEERTRTSRPASAAESTPRWRAIVARIRDNELMTNDPAFDMEGIPWQPVSPRLAPVRVVTAVIALGIPFLAGLILSLVFGGWVWSAPVVVAALLVWLLWLVPRQVRAIRYAELADDLLIRKGIMFRSMVMVPYGRMQYVEVKAGPVARWQGIAEVELYTASAQSDASIPGLPADEAARLRDQLSARGEAKLAGL